MFRYKQLFAIVCFCLLSAGLVSCKKWMDLKPTDGIIREDFWKTKEDVHSAVIGCYASLLGDLDGSDKSLSELFFLWGELRADMLTATTGTTAEELQVMNVNTVTSNSITNWSMPYQVINYCNTVLDNAPAVLASDPTFTQAALDGYLSEARALRALIYFYLVRTYGDVPLVLKATSSDQQLSYPAKTKKEDVLTQIVADLKEAETKAVTTYGAADKDKGRITKYTINATQADVYLWMDDYTNCITACDKVINAKTFGLVAGNAAWFSSLYYNGNSPEGIFEFQFNAQKNNSFYAMFAAPNRRLMAANKVMDQVFTTSDFQADIRADGASVLSSNSMIWKQVGANSNTVRPISSYSAHWIVYRYADILLMKAEALAQLKTPDAGAQALALVYTIRNRANALSGTDNNPGATDYEGIAKFILEERSREFMFEGKRWYDVLRYVKRDNYAHIDFLLDMVAEQVPANIMNSAKAKMLDHNSHYFPIYNAELLTNKNLVQNPFYK
jgi:hypothetical protein